MLKIPLPRLRFIVLCILAIITIVLGFFVYNSKQTHPADTFDPVKMLSTLNTSDSVDDFLEIEQMIGVVMKKYGTKAGFELIDEGERQHIISNDACHGLLHYVGHAAYAEHPNDYDALLSVVEGTNCIGGYLHGIEAEIVLTSSNVIEDVEDFCTFQKDRGVAPGACFHGVGHSGTELYQYDIPKSLALCDALAGGPEKDLTNCYRGVFSEVGNIVTGYDGHTGLEIDSITIAGLDPEKPFEYCQTLNLKHQSSCKSQLVKVAIMNLPMENWYEACLNPSLDLNTIDICVNIVSGIYVRHELSFQDTTSLPKDINKFNEKQQEVAILGSAETFSGYLSDGARKDWKTFCSTFDNLNTKEYCYVTFEDMAKNNSSPWMKRTDIR